MPNVLPNTREGKHDKPQEVLREVRRIAYSDLSDAKARLLIMIAAAPLKASVIVKHIPQLFHR
jgi:hypothetical protein